MKVEFISEYTDITELLTVNPAKECWYYTPGEEHAQKIN